MLYLQWKECFYKRCVCIHSGHFCISCLLLRELCCVNSLQHHQRPSDEAHSKVHNQCLDGGSSDDTNVHSRDTFSQVHTGNTDCSCVLLDDDSIPFQNKSASIDCDDLMRKAYGTTFIQSTNLF